MKKRINLFFKTLFFSSLVLITLQININNSYSLPNAPTAPVNPKWICNLTTGTSPGCGSEVTGDATGYVSSPVLVDMNNDGVLDVVTATRDGRIIAIRDNGNSGKKIFDIDAALAFGMSPGSQRIESSPAVADIDGDGLPEVVIGVGKSHGSNCYKGGVLVLEHNGSVKSGWPKLSHDHGISPAGCPDPIYPSPALGDLDNDGDLEIVYAGFDKRIYARHHNGTVLPGFPIDSKDFARFGWPILEGALADTIWGSPTLADIDGDGYLDIIIGTDEGNFPDFWGGNSGGWDCPYASPSVIDWASGYCGGTLYVIDRFGNSLPGFPIQTLEVLDSTPAIYDVDRDGFPEIFMGTGSWYFHNSPDSPEYGFRIFAWDHLGNDLPGWEGGKVVGGTTPAAPAIGDIDGDGDPDIIALSMDEKLYAWHHDGSAVAGFPMTPKSLTNSYEYNVGRGVTLADYTNDGAMEIFVAVGWSVAIIDGAGNQLSSTSTAPHSAPYYTAKGTLSNIPAVGDIDNDGNLELIANHRNLYVWDLEWQGTPSSGEADWPMFKYNAARTGYPAQLTLVVSPDDIFVMQESGGAVVQRTVQIDKAQTTETMNWTATTTNPAWISLSSAAGTAPDSVTVDIAPSGLGVGTYNGNINVAATVSGEPAVKSPYSVSITLYVVDRLYQAFLPAILRQ